MEIISKTFQKKEKEKKKVVSKWLISLYQGFLHSVHLSAPLPTVINDNTSRVLGQWFSYMETNMENSSEKMVYKEINMENILEKVCLHGKLIWKTFWK